MKKILLYVRTIRYLKYRQIIFQVYYLFKNLFPDNIASYSKYTACKASDLMPKFFPRFIRKEGDNKTSFNFLNQIHDFKDGINWNFIEFGKLWNYNLQYLDYLFDKESDLEDRLESLLDISNWIMDSKLRLEPYPVSLRIVNSVLFISCNNIRNELIHQALCRQIHFLESNLEYHIDANHLLENAIALRVAALYLSEEQLDTKSIHLLKDCLSEQILNDGAHCERSPMYHAILCSRLLNLYGIMNSDCVDRNLVFDNLKSMSSWLWTISNGCTTFSCLQDSTFGIAPELNVLFDDLRQAGIKLEATVLRDSNYRILKDEKYFCIFNIGEMSPSYQPGHAHADILSFVLLINEIYLIVDPGISSYEKNQRRELERSTAMHNTVVFNQKNQSEIWAGFRVGQRAKCKLIMDNPDCIGAEVSNYAGKNRKHNRSIGITEEGIRIIDSTSCSDDVEQCAYFHFDREVVLEMDQKKGNFVLANSTKIEFNQAISIILEDYEQAIGFNKLQSAKCIKINFKNRLETNFYV